MPRFLSVFLLIFAFIINPVSATAQTEEFTPPEPPAFLEEIDSEEDYQALTEEQQAELQEYISKVRPSAAAAGVGAETPANTVSCFDYYTFGSIQADFSPTVGSTVSGIPLAFTGQLKNENSYPVVDGAVYAKIFRQPADGSLPVNGYDVVDQFFVAEDISLAAGEIKPLTFTWDIPAYLPSGNYQAAFFYTSAHKFNLLGLSFTDDVVGNVANFSIIGEVEQGSYLKKDTVTVDGNDYYFAAFTPKVDKEKPITIEVDVVNPTDQVLKVPLTWNTYAWDQQSPKNQVSESVDTITVPANDSVRVSTTVNDTSSSVYLVIARAEYEDMTSILNVRFTRDGVPTTRINFPAVTSYPLQAGEENTLFSCLHGAGTLPIVPDGKLVLTLADQDDNPIHTYTYEGDVTGAMMGVADSFTPEKTYKTFTLTAALYNNDELVDIATMHYDCEALGGGDCNAPSAPVEDTDGQNNLGYLVGTFFGVVLLAMAAILFFRRRTQAGDDDLDDDGGDGMSGESSGTTPSVPPQTPLAAFFLAILIGTAAFLGGGQVVEAKSAVWNTSSVPALYYLWSGSYPYPNDNLSVSGSAYGWGTGLQPNANVTVSYNTHLEDADSGTPIADGATLPVGTKVKVVWDRQDSDISWFGTGASMDSPYGTWRGGATDPPDYCTNYFVNTVSSFGFWDIYIPLSVNPPAMNISGTGLSCVGDVCTVTGPGSKTITATFPSTYGKFYYRYYGQGAAAYGCHIERNEPMRKCILGFEWWGGCGQNSLFGNPEAGVSDYQLNIPQRTITYNLTAAGAVGNPPTAPTITDSAGNSHLVGDSQSFTIQATDPDGDTIRYGIDWDNNGTVDQWTGSVPSGTSLPITRAWATGGVKTFQALTEDSTAAQSGWATHAITICDSGYTWNGSSCEAVPPPPPTGTLMSSGCAIPDGDNNCQATLSWDVENVDGGRLTEDGTTIQTSITTDGSRTVTLDTNPTTYELYDDTTHLDTRTLTAACATDLAWSTDTNTCETVPDAPTLSIEADPSIIRSGQTTDITITITGTEYLVCDIYNADTTAVEIDYTNAPNPQDFTVPTRPLTATQVITLSCPVPGFSNLPPYTAETRVEIVPTVQEI